MWHSNDMFHHMFKEQSVTLVSLKVPSGCLVPTSRVSADWAFKKKSRGPSLASGGTLLSFRRVLGPPEHEYVRLRDVDHVVDPADALLDAEVAPLRLRHQVGFGHLGKEVECMLLLPKQVILTVASQ